jgi:hypothetical protein
VGTVLHLGEKMEGRHYCNNALVEEVGVGVRFVLLLADRTNLIFVPSWMLNIAFDVVSLASPLFLLLDILSGSLLLDHNTLLVLFARDLHIRSSGQCGHYLFVCLYYPIFWIDLDTNNVNEAIQAVSWICCRVIGYAMKSYH